MSSPPMRDNAWLESRFQFLWTSYYADVRRGYPITVKFGRAARYRYGPGTLMVHLALDGPVPWTAAEARRSAYVHVGPYQALPQKWADLKGELAARGEAIGSPSLEVYGHHCDDPAKLETTILIGLRAEPA